MNDLVALDALESSAAAINNAGTVAGALTFADGSSRAFIHSNGAMTELVTLGGRFSYASAINDAGQVVGGSSFAGDSTSAAFLFSQGQMTSLGTLGGAGSNAYGINNFGEIVGQSLVDDSFSDASAFLYENGTMYNLNSLISANSGWMLQSAFALNDSEQIVGEGLNPQGFAHAYVLAPISSEVSLPEPAISIIIVACAGSLLLRRRTN
jgi:probable HAF family extracellular repeat protein